MRGRWNHTGPEVTFKCPSDNTSGHVMAQVRAWSGNPPLNKGVPVHPEIAMEIAAWHQAPGNGFAVFTGTGTLPFGFKEEIQREIEEVRQACDTESAESLLALRALLAYVYACR